MALDLRITDARCNAALDALFSTSANNGLLRIYEAARPAGEPTTSGNGDLLAQLTMNATAFQSAAAQSGQSYNRLVANSITQDSSADDTGTAAYFLLTDSGGTTALMSGTVDTATADMIIDNTSIAIGATVTCSSFEVRLEKGWSTA